MVHVYKTMKTPLLVSLLLLYTSGIALGLPDDVYEGKQFMVVYFSGFNLPDSGAKPFNFLFIHSEKDGQCTLEFKVSHTAQEFVKQHEYLLPGRTIKVPITQAVENPLNTQITPKGVYVNCTVPVVVYVQNRDKGMTNVYHGIPYKSLGKEYYIPGAPHDSFLSLAAVEDDTHIQITIKSTCSYEYNGKTYGNGDQIDIILNANDIFELSRAQVDLFGNGTCDVAGSHVKGDKPFAAFAGATCLFLFGKRCDQGFVQVPPPTLWGTDFVVSSMIGHNTGYEVRVLASEDDTHISIHEFPNDKVMPSHHYRYSLQSGDVFTDRYNDDAYLVIQNTKPVLVTQYLSEYPIIVTPISQYPTIQSKGFHYVFNTMEKHDGDGINEQSYAKVMVGTNNTGNVQLNKQPIAPGKWRDFPMVEISLCQFAIASGTHLLDSTSSNTPGVVQVYGVSPLRGETWGYTAVPSSTG